MREVGPGPDQTDRYVLESGEVVIDQGRDNQLYPPGRGSARVGDLLIAGMEGQKTWYLVIPPGPPSAADRPCFSLWVTGVDRENAIDTSIGVQLPKTADFDRGPDTDGKYNEQPHSFCLDERGAIYRWV